MKDTKPKTKVPEPDGVGAPITKTVGTDHSRVFELDGVRALAIWMVLLFHIFLAWPVPDGAFAQVPGAILKLAAHGWLGVDLFFVLSGFLITGILLDSRARPHYFRNFYARRFLRIMPLYFTVVFVFLIFYASGWRYLVLSTFFAANLARLFHIPIPHGPGALWSLAVEEHFYLVWPVLVYVLDRRRLAILAATIVIATPIARGIAAAHGVPVDGEIYEFSWFRFDGLALGGLLAIVVRSFGAKRANYCKLAAVCVLFSTLITVSGSFFGLNHAGVMSTALRFNQAQFLFAALLLVAVGFQGTPWTALLRNRFACISGNLSYCLYLINVAVGDAFQWLARHFSFNPSGPSLVAIRGLFLIVVSFSIAALSKRYLEDPFLRLKRYFAEPGAVRTVSEDSVGPDPTERSAPPEPLSLPLQPALEFAPAPLLSAHDAGQVASAKFGQASSAPEVPPTQSESV